MQVFRLSREAFALPLSGKGAALKGARWNSPGIEMIYTAENRSLAMAEVAVHLTWATMPQDFVMLTIEIPENVSRTVLEPNLLPPNWKNFPHNTATQKLGDQFVLENHYCLLFVPSVITPGEFNVLINPNHTDFSEIKVVKSEPFPLDSRLAGSNF